MSEWKSLINTNTLTHLIVEKLQALKLALEKERDALIEEIKDSEEKDSNG